MGFSTKYFSHPNPSFWGLPIFSPAWEPDGLSNFTPLKSLLYLFVSNLSYLLTPYIPIYPRLDVQAKRFLAGIIRLSLNQTYTLKDTAQAHRNL